MQYKTSKSNNVIWSLLSQLATRTQKLAVACICAEKCRFCGREIALGYNGGSTVRGEEEGEGDGDGDGGGEGEERQEEVNGVRYINDDSFEGNSTTINHRFNAINALAPYAEPESHHPGKSSQSIKWQSLLSFLSVPAQSIRNELVSLSIAATHAALVPPALISFTNRTDPYPRLSECLCSICWEEIEIDLPTLGFVQLSCKSQIELPVASGANYEGKVKELIRTFKYDGDAILAADLASIMSLGWSTLSDYMPASSILLVPVPLHESRKRTRGYNQSELLARELGKLISLPVSANALKRKNATRPQQTLGKSERSKNVANSFVGNRKKLAGRTIVLIDDVCTSGSTLAACADEALACGALSVVALTIARALLAHDR